MGLLKEVTNNIIATTHATKEALVAKPKKRHYLAIDPTKYSHVKHSQLGAIDSHLCGADWLLFRV